MHVPIQKTPRNSPLTPLRALSTVIPTTENVEMGFC